MAWAAMHRGKVFVCVCVASAHTYIQQLSHRYADHIQSNTVRKMMWVTRRLLFSKGVQTQPEITPSCQISNHSLSSENTLNECLSPTVQHRDYLQMPVQTRLVVISNTRGKSPFSR